MEKSTDVHAINRKKTDESLKWERTRVDEFLDAKRKVVENSADKAKGAAGIGEDDIQWRERNQKKAIVGSLLGKERKDTDSNLLSERNYDDSSSQKYQFSAKEAKGALAIRDQYLATVSHDLKNPLNAISLTTGVMKRSFFKDQINKELFLDYFEQIERNVGIMERLINDLLDVEQMVNGAVVLNLKKCNLGELLKEVQVSFGPAIEHNHLKLEIAGLKDVAVAEIDHDRIFQVLSNLIGNAIKFAKKNGTITIGCEKKHERVSIFVKDDGEGIPEEKKELIFDRFCQLNFNDRRGMGLGLFISKWIVELHGGEINVESTLGAGSIFKINIPVEQLVH